MNLRISPDGFGGVKLEKQYSGGFSLIGHYTGDDVEVIIDKLTLARNTARHERRNFLVKERARLVRERDANTAAIRTLIKPCMVARSASRS